MTQIPSELDRLVDLYLRGELDEEQRSKIEIQMLEEPEFFREVQRREVLIQELHDVSELKNDSSTQNEDENLNNERVTRLNFGQWIAQPLSMAATIAMAIGLGVIFQGRPSDVGSRLELTPMSNIGSYITLESLRGQETIFASTGISPILITIDAGPSPANFYQIDLLDSTGDVISSQNLLQADSEGWLRVLINSELQGNFFVRVSSSEPDLSETRYPINFSN